jgi:hypothetical protein
MKTKIIFLAVILISLNGIMFSQTAQNDRLIQLRPQGYYAIVDSLSGKVITALKYDEVRPFKDNLAVVSTADKWGVIDNNGIEIVAPKYNSIKDYNEGRAVVVMDKKYGIINKKGTEIVPCTYEYISTYVNGLATARLSGKYGFLNIQGNPICPLKYDDVDVLYDESKLLRVELSNKYGYLDRSGKEIIAPQYDIAIGALFFENGVGVVMKDSLWGVINESGTIVIPLKYKWLGTISEKLIPFKENDKYGYINLKNERIINPSYQFAESFRGGLAVVQYNGKWGVIDKKGVFIIPAQYEDDNDIDIEFRKDIPYIVTRKNLEYENTGMYTEYAFCFDRTGKSLLPQASSINTIWLYDNYIMVAQRNHNMEYVNNGIYDFNGKVIIPNDYVYIKIISDSLFITINRESKYSVYNLLGEQIIKEHDFMFETDSLIYLNNGGSLKDDYIQGGKFGVSDLSGNKLCDLKYDKIGTFIDNTAWVMRNGKMGFINKQGKEMVEPKYDYIINGMFYEGLATVNIGGVNNPQYGFQGGKWGFIDKTGNIAIDLIYDGALVFNEGLASVKKGELVGVIDATGKTIVPFNYQEIGVFSEGIAYFVKDNLYGFIDKTGKIIINNTFQYAGDFNDGLAMIAKDNKVGYINQTGNVVIPIQYDNGDIFIDGYAIVVKNGQNHLINKKGEVIK